MVQDGTAVMQGVMGNKDVQAGLRTQFEFVTAAQQKAMALAVEIAEITRRPARKPSRSCASAPRPVPPRSSRSRRRAA
ncbi:MAG: hypothetical protein WDO24_29300 [Pseudomonadota bacterium]